MIKRRKDIKVEATRIAKTIRLGYMAYGKSPDYHIFDLSDEFFRINRRKNRKTLSLLRKARDFYFSCDCLERKIILAEILEKGRYYKFWYLPFFEPCEYVTTSKSIMERFVEAF